MNANTNSSPRYIRVLWPWIGMIYKIWYVWSSPCTIDQNLHDEDIQRIKISMEAEDIKWIKISIMAEDIWHLLESSHESWNLVNIGTIKEVAYMRCHQFGRSSTQSSTSTCPTIWIELSRSNILVHRLITSHWCIPLTDARSPTDNENWNQGTRVQSNKCE